MPKWSGFFYGGGRIWFFNTGDSGLRLGQVNVTAIDAALLPQHCKIYRRHDAPLILLAAVEARLLR